MIIELGLNISIVDKLMGLVIGCFKIGIFWFGDLVGYDIGINVIKGVRENCLDDE